ncbi:MAG TPA: thiamine pyrophosphate-dependent enzyme [Stellaceae bacterium]|nr:thiamine pyrophosphate-dependent enzyme [Stellaceae bacterium]
MNREEAITAVAAVRGDAAVLMGPGVNCGLLYERADTPATIYNMDMGYATAMALGVALARPRRRVLSIEGEGSFYAGSTVLSTIWRMKPANLAVLVLDNGVWGTADGAEPTATACGVDLEQLALAAGWSRAQVHAPAGPNELGSALGLALAGNGPHFIVAKTDPATDRHLRSTVGRPRPKRHILDCAVLMRADLKRDV